MSKKNKDDKDRVVFSTNPGQQFDKDEEQDVSLPASQQTLYISLQRLKGDKIATVVENFIGKEDDLDALGKQLKSKCGVGGTVKDGVILLQGEHREKVMAFLGAIGYKTKRKGG